MQQINLSVYIREQKRIGSNAILIFNQKFNV